jgi:hypothetical protein
MVPTHVYATAWDGEKGKIYTELYVPHSFVSAVTKIWGGQPSNCV